MPAEMFADLFRAFSSSKAEGPAIEIDLRFLLFAPERDVRSGVYCLTEDKPNIVFSVRNKVSLQCSIENPVL